MSFANNAPSANSDPNNDDIPDLIPIPQCENLWIAPIDDLQQFTIDISEITENNISDILKQDEFY